MKRIVQDELYCICGAAAKAKTPLLPLPQLLPSDDPFIRVLRPKSYFEPPIIRNPIVVNDV